MLLCKACKISIVNIDKKQGYFDPIFLPVVTITVSETRSNRVYLLNLRTPARHINPNPRSSMVNGSGQVSTVPVGVEHGHAGVQSDESLPLEHSCGACPAGAFDAAISALCHG